MDLLKTISEQEIYPDYKYKEEKKNGYRKAVRGIVFDDENKVGLINVSKHNYYKLPGGGAEGSESDEDVLKRECVEELGCNVDIGLEVGKILEHRDKINTDQESFCYLAKINGEKGEQKLVGYEIDDGFEPVWVEIDEAIRLVENSNPDTYDGPFIKIRDLVFLKAAKKLIKK